MCILMGNLIAIVVVCVIPGPPGLSAGPAENRGQSPSKRVQMQQDVSGLCPCGIFASHLKNVFL